MDYIVEDLDLPNLDRKKYSEIIVESAAKKRISKIWCKAKACKEKLLCVK